MDNETREKTKTKIADAIANWALVRDSIREYEAEHGKIFETHRMLVSEYNLKLEMAKNAMKELDSSEVFEEEFKTQKRTTVTVQVEAAKPYLHRQMLLDNPDLVSELDTPKVISGNVDAILQNPDWIKGLNPKTVQRLIENRAFPAGASFLTKTDVVAVYAPKPLVADA